MKLTELFGSTLRKAPANAETLSYQLLARGGYIRAAEAGMFIALPLAERAINKLRARMRHEMSLLSAQEVGAYAELGALAADIQSYKELPKMLFAFDEVRRQAHPRLGLFGAAASPSVSFYLLASSESELTDLKKKSAQKIQDLFKKLTLQTSKTAGGNDIFLAEKGDISFIHCASCGYLEKAALAQRSKMALSAETPRELEKVETPDAHTIEALAAFLNIPKEKTAKAVFMTATIGDEENLVFAILRGDMDLSEAKLLSALEASALRPATDEEIAAVGAVPGYASPVGMENVLVVVDDLIPESANLVAGANEAGCHLRNVNYGRDYEAAIVTDLALAKEGDRCPKCNAVLAAAEGVELATMQPVGPLNATFSDAEGKGQPIWGAVWTLDFGRTFAAVAESHHDEYGLALPQTAAPYDIHLVWLPSKKLDTKPDAEDIYLNLMNTGFTVLYDDRDARAGAKFNDADLIGCPVRITVGEKALNEDSVEIKMRDEKDRALVELGDIVNYVLEKLG